VLRKSGILVNSPRADLPILGLANREVGLAENDAFESGETAVTRALETQNTIVVKKIDDSLLVEFKNNLRRIRPVKCVQAASIDLPKTGNKLMIERFEQTSFKNRNPFESVSAFASPNLRVLDLSSSMLKSCNIELPNLRRLDLSKNRLRSRLLIKAPRLRVLNISENKFARLLFTPLPHLSVLDASCNQLIDVQNLSEIAPRVMFLNLAENFIDKAPARLSSLLHLDLTNNSLCNLDELSSPFLASLRAQFNNFKESDHLKVLPFLTKDSFLWADSPKEILALNVKTKEDMNADFDHGRLSSAVEQFDWSEIGITKKSLTLVDKSYWQLWHMRQYILQSDKHHYYDPLPAIGRFLKSLFFKQRKLAKEKNAVEVIGAWWAAANVRLKIRRARKQIRATNNAEYKLEEFDVDSFYESLNVEQELGDMEENLLATPKLAEPQLQNHTRHHKDARTNSREFEQKQPLLTYYDVEGNTHSVMNAYDSLVDEEKIRSQAQELFAWKQMGDAPNNVIYAESFKSSKVSSSATVLPSIPETIVPKISKKEEKILNIMQSWNVGRETAERMYLSNNRMKGKKTRKKESQKSSVSATNSVSYIQELNSMTSLASARSRDRTWIKPKYQSDSQRTVVNNWVQKIDEGMSVTPEPHDPAPYRVKSIEKSDSDHFSFAKNQLSPFSLRSSTPPLPPLKKKASHVPAWH